MTIYTMSVSQIRNNTSLIEKSTSVLITRSDRVYTTALSSLGIKHCIHLAPSWGLYNEAQSIKKDGGDFDQWYDSNYVPRFYREMRQQFSVNVINDLRNKLQNGGIVVLICFCTKERCHRRLLAEILRLLTNKEVIHL